MEENRFVRESNDRTVKTLKTNTILSLCCRRRVYTVQTSRANGRFACLGNSSHVGPGRNYLWFSAVTPWLVTNRYLPPPRLWGETFRIWYPPPSLSYLMVISNLSLKQISPPLQAFPSLCLPHSSQSSSLQFPLPFAPLPKGDHQTEVLSLENMVWFQKNICHRRLAVWALHTVVHGTGTPHVWWMSDPEGILVIFKTFFIFLKKIKLVSNCAFAAE